MYVVKRSFRNYNQMIASGTVVEPDAIKRFKTHLRDGRIIEVSEQDFDKWNEYFKVRYGVSIEQKVEPEKVEPEKVEPEKVEPEKVEPEKVEPESIQKVVARATAKAAN